MLLAEFIRTATAALGSLYPQEEARSLIFLLCEEWLGTRSYTHIIEPEFSLDKQQEDRLQDAVGRLCKGEPIQYVLGFCDFCGRRFRVTPSTLIPRPETELLAREAVKIADRVRRMRLPFGKSAAPVKVLDLCTGSGNIAWSVALGVPGAQVTAVDISAEALEVAQGQDFSSEMKESGALAPVFLEADLLQEPPAALDSYDLIVANPPYVMEREKAQMRPNVLEYEPAQALFVQDEDPLIFYRAIVSWSRQLLARDGKGLAEINESLGPQTLALFRGAGFSDTAIVKDYQDKDRFVFYMNR